MKQTFADLLELTKPRITVFVVLTAFLGFAACYGPALLNGRRR